MSGFQFLIQACAELLHPLNLLLLFGSTTLGMIIGALPGLSATMGIALLTGLTYNVSRAAAMTILMGVYVGAIYGGSLTAILINVPGTGSAAATALDGYPLAKKGEGANAIKLTRAASMVGTFFGALCLVFFTPMITKLALQFTSAEFFMLSFFGILICGSISARDLSIKGWAAGILGVLISMIGIDSIQAIPRFVFGNYNLMGGVNLIPAMIGFFAVPQIIKGLCGDNAAQEVLHPDSAQKVNTVRELTKHLKLIVKSSLIGVGIGALPGVGENIAAWLAYDSAKKSSKQPEKFGTGIYEAVIAPEVANNAAIGGALIPLFSLAVPGSPPAAVLLGALYLHGIRPGPLLAQEFPAFTYEMTALLFFATVMLWVVGICIARPIVSVIKIPNSILMPIVAALCIIGAYALNLSRFDLVVLFVFGLAGYWLDVMGYPSAAIILGILLGSMLDDNFRRTLMLGGGSPLAFFTRPISLLFALAILYSLIAPFLSKKVRGKFKEMTKAAD